MTEIVFRKEDRERTHQRAQRAIGAAKKEAAKRMAATTKSLDAADDLPSPLADPHQANPSAANPMIAGSESSAEVKMPKVKAGPVAEKRSPREQRKAA